VYTSLAGRDGDGEGDFEGAFDVPMGVECAAEGEW
jgi:hypothetical protein